MTQDQMPDEDDMMAAEYALGLLTGDRLTAARARLASDASFSQSVTGWEIRLAALAEDLAPEVPSPAAKKALFARVFPDNPQESFWTGIRFWQGLAAAAVLILGAVLFLDPPQRQDLPGPLYMAEIAAEAGDFRVVAVVDKTTNEIFMTRTLGRAQEGRILQVWAHGEGAPAISVGLWPEGDTVRLPMPPTIAAVTGTLTLGVSEEPPGGSPTGSPSGRVFGTVDIPGVSGET